jgi:hypothetical protein
VDDFEKMAVGVFKVDSAAAEIVVDGAMLLLMRIGPIF